MPEWVSVVVAVFAAVMASSGFWAWIMKKSTKKDAQLELLLAIAHDKILWLVDKYCTRGDWITEDEYENLMFLWNPYEACGGNGAGKKAVDRANAELKIVRRPPNGSEEVELTKEEQLFLKKRFKEASVISKK